MKIVEIHNGQVVIDIEKTKVPVWTIWRSKPLRVVIHCIMWIPETNSLMFKVHPPEIKMPLFWARSEEMFEAPEGAINEIKSRLLEGVEKQENAV